MSARAQRGGRSATRGVQFLAVLAALGLGALLAASIALGSNDTMAEADGPILSGQTYQGTTGTENDVDWWVFYTGATTQLDIALMGLGPEDCFGPYMNLTDADGEIIEQSYHVDRNETKHILYTVGVGTFYIAVNPYNVAPCAGSEAVYRLWINASPALLSEPPYIPPPPAPPSPGSQTGSSAGCRQARSRVSSLSSRLRRAGGFRQRQRLRVKLRRARSQAASRC